MTWMEILALAINTVGTVVVLKIAATYVPALRARFPSLVPILAGVLGPAVMYAERYLAGLTGQVIDLSPLLGIFSGGAGMAVTMYMLQRRREVAARASAATVNLAGHLDPV